MTYMVDIQLPNEAGDCCLFRTYYDPKTCEIIHATTYITEEGKFKKMSIPDWAAWQDYPEVVKTIEIQRRMAVCNAEGHCVMDCPHGPWNISCEA